MIPTRPVFVASHFDDFEKNIIFFGDDQKPRESLIHCQSNIKGHFIWLCYMLSVE